METKNAVTYYAQNEKIEGPSPIFKLIGYDHKGKPTILKYDYSKLEDATHDAGCEKSCFVKMELVEILRTYQNDNE